jgi:hypothetical protein
LGGEEIREYVEEGVEEIYDIPENEPYEDKLGEGRFDGLETWLHLPAAASADSPGFAAAGTSSGSKLRVFPNPAPRGTKIWIELKGAGDAPELHTGVYDLGGRLVRTLPERTTGLLSWDGHDNSGHPASAGIYFVHVGPTHRMGPGWTAKVIVAEPSER